MQRAKIQPKEFSEEQERLVKLGISVLRQSLDLGFNDLRVVQEMIAAGVPRGFSGGIFHTQTGRFAPMNCVYCRKAFRAKTTAGICRISCYDCGDKGKMFAPAGLEARERANARGTANMAVKRGKLVKQPCVNCGDDRAEKHHPDYSKPLDVLWLCRPCHMQEHRKAGVQHVG